MTNKVATRQTPPQVRAFYVRFQRVFDNFVALGTGLAVLLVWEIWVRVSGTPTFVLPPPSAIFARIATDFPLLLVNARVTFLEVVYGFGLAITVGIPIALGIFYWRPFERAVYPLLVALQTVPKVALAPILVLWFGFGWAPKVIVAFLISFFPIVIATVVGLQSLNQNMVYLVRSMGASEWQTFFKVRLPAALPNIFGGFKVGAGLSVVGAIIGEYVASDRGLGYLQLTANAEFDTVLTFAALIMIIMIGVTLFFVINSLERLFVKGR